MKLVNETRYDTRELRKLLIAVFRAQPHGLQTRVDTWRDLRVKIVYTKPQFALAERVVANAKASGSASSIEISERHLERVRARAARYVSGCASLHGYRARLRLPRGSVPTAALAAVWVHELWHVGGSEHRDFPGLVMDCATTPFAWVTERFGATLSEREVEKPARPADLINPEHCAIIWLVLI